MIYYGSTNFHLIAMLIAKIGHEEDIDFELKHNYYKYKIIMLHKIKL